jgi:peroxiredoxin 2/4
MHELSDDVKGPALGAPAPFFDVTKRESRISRDNFKGSWVILFSHPDDLIPIFKTRTITYILCKRRIKAVAVGHKFSPEATSFRNFIGKYLENHILTVIDDADEQIAMQYGLNNSGNGTPEKGVFLIDPQGHLRIKLYFPMTKERDFAEILGLVDALQTAEKQSKQGKQPGGSAGFIVKWDRLIASNSGRK